VHARKQHMFVRIGPGRRIPALAPARAETDYPGATGSRTARSVADAPGQPWSEVEDQYLRRIREGNLAPSWKDVAEHLAGLSLVSRRPKAVKNRWCRLREEE
jgi:hypothetical protein